MIHEIEVSNFQSLKKIQVKLGRFTVVTGRTGAGKSGLIRAVKTLVFNARGTSYITRGEKQCSVSMSGSDGDETAWAAFIQRGAKNEYRLIDGGLLAEQKISTKLAGKVPEAVSDTLRLGEINFAGQFDRPYLLDSTGGDVARVLGRLTNVTVLFRAAQEANRRRLQVSGELKTRQADLSSLAEQAQQYATLGAELAAVGSAEAALAELAELTRRRERLDFVRTAALLAQETLDRLRPVPEPPSLERLDGLMVARSHLAALIADQANADYQLAFAEEQEKRAVLAEEICKQELASYISQWGVCPECGQPVQVTHEHEGAAQ